MHALYTHIRTHTRTHAHTLTHAHANTHTQTHASTHARTYTHTLVTSYLHIISAQNIYLKTSAPLLMSVFTTAPWPCRAAMCRAVFFSLSMISTLAPAGVPRSITDTHNQMLQLTMVNQCLSSQVEAVYGSHMQCSTTIFVLQKYNT